MKLKKINSEKNNWKTLKLGDIVTFQRGFDLPKSNFKTGNYPVIGSNGIIGHHNKYKAKGPGITIGRSGNLGEPYFIEGDYWPHNTTLFSLKFNNSYPKFIYYLIKRIKLNRFNAGSAVPTLNRNHIHPIKVIIPKDINEQKLISNILSSLDEKIELNNKINSILERISQTIFKHWFIDFEFPNEQGKPYKSSGGEFIDSGLGKIPKGWEVLYLKDVLGSLESGSRPKGGVDVFSNGIPSIGAENILGLGVYDYSKTKYVPEDFYNSMKTGKIINGDVLLYKDGAKIGRKSIFMFGFPFRKCCVNEHVFILRSNEKVTPIYLYFWLEKPEITNFIINLNSNSAQPGLNRVGVESVKILKPEAKILNKFNSILVPIFEKIFLNCLQNQTLSQVRDTLLPKLITGKIRLI